MKPETPVVPGKTYEETIISKGEVADFDLPAISFHIEGRSGYITRWTMDEDERAEFLRTGNLYIWIWTEDGTIRPIGPTPLPPVE